MTHGDHPIERIVSHVDDADLAGPVFGRDCPEYTVTLPTAGTLLVLVNHFKSKGYGAASDSNRRRAAPGRAGGRDLRRPVEPRASSTSSSSATSTTPPTRRRWLPCWRVRPAHRPTFATSPRTPSFDDGGWPGTYTTGRAANKIDYILCSPAVFAVDHRLGHLPQGRLDRVRVAWEMYPTLTREQDAASDHAAIWADLAL